MNTNELKDLMSNATPGPWRVEQDTTLIWGCCDPDDASNRGMGYPVAECRITPTSNWAKGPDEDAGESNARLISLAPQLAADNIALQAEVERLTPTKTTHKEGEFDMAVLFDAVEIGGETYVSMNTHTDTIRRLCRSSERVTKLEAENEKLREALERVADGDPKDYTDNYIMARAALNT